MAFTTMTTANNHGVVSFMAAFCSGSGNHLELKVWRRKLPNVINIFLLPRSMTTLFEALLTEHSLYVAVKARKQVQFK